MTEVINRYEIYQLILEDTEKITNSRQQQAQIRRRRKLLNEKWTDPISKDRRVYQA